MEKHVFKTKVSYLTPTREFKANELLLKVHTTGAGLFYFCFLYRIHIGMKHWSKKSSNFTLAKSK